MSGRNKACDVGGQRNLAPYKNLAPDLGRIARAGDTQNVLRFCEFIGIYSSPIMAVSTPGCEGGATGGGGSILGEDQHRSTTKNTNH